MAPAGIPRPVGQELDRQRRSSAHHLAVVAIQGDAFSLVELFAVPVMPSVW